ncbi:MAG TPA: cytochrome c3 family protein [Bacteroidota bacterium]|nr:cytochrome c3 family protein [Bacteroidota bacterium]
MAQIFHPSMKVLSRASIAAALVLGVAVTWAAIGIYDSGYTTDVDVPREQVVPFSHKRHVDGNGIACEYCHTSVERSSFAGIPPTYTCMTCHSQIYTRSAMLEPVRASLRTNEPLRWIRVNDLPDFVYFNHSIHIAKGVGCVTCHGRVDQMPLTWRAHTLFMSWCLDCHRAPEKYLRPREEVLNMDYVPPPDQEALGRRLVKEYAVDTARITDCSTCHR